jgi:F-type H+-transporting ATPase subunit b
MEILGNFGFNPWLLTAQIVNFLVVFFLLRKFLYKPLLTVLKNREKTIKEGLEKAEEGAKMLEQAVEKEKELLRRAQVQSKTILADARKQAEEVIKEADEHAKKRAEKLLQDAREQIDQDIKMAQAKLATQVGTLAVEMLEKSLGGLVSEKTEEEIIQKAVKQFKGN